MDPIPDDVPERIKEVLRRKDSMSEEELDKELKLLYTCNEDCPKTNCTKLCIKVLGHSGKHYCVTHGNFD